MIFSNRIKTLRLNSKFTQKSLAQKLGVTEVTVGCWEKGTKTPSMQSIIEMSKLFGVSADFILGIDDTGNGELSIIKADELNLITKYRQLSEKEKAVVIAVCDLGRKEHNITKRYIPKYLSSAAAGFGKPHLSNQFEIIPVTPDIPQQTDFAVIIDGDSMCPLIKNGETVYVKQVSALESGDIGIFNIDGYIVCKQYQPDFLYSVNKKYEPIKLTEKYFILGKVLLQKN